MIIFCFFIIFFPFFYSFPIVLYFVFFFLSSFLIPFSPQPLPFLLCLPYLPLSVFPFPASNFFHFLSYLFHHKYLLSILSQLTFPIFLTVSIFLLHSFISSLFSHLPFCSPFFYLNFPIIIYLSCLPYLFCMPSSSLSFSPSQPYCLPPLHTSLSFTCQFMSALLSPRTPASSATPVMPPHQVFCEPGICLTDRREGKKEWRKKNTEGKEDTRR